NWRRCPSSAPDAGKFPRHPWSSRPGPWCAVPLLARTGSLRATRPLPSIRSLGRACLNPLRPGLDVLRQSPAILQATQALLGHTIAGCRKLTRLPFFSPSSLTRPAALAPFAILEATTILL